MDYEKIKEAAKSYEADMTKFLRDIVKFPGESCDEKAHIDRIAEEMRKLEFDKVEIDPMGNVLGFMGTGETLIGFDAHIDTVGIGNKSNWNFDPYEGYETETEIGGRGVSDQCGGLVSAVYGARIMKDLGLLSSKYTVLVTGTVQEEDCDGLCWQYIINEDKIRPEFVVSTEPTDGGITVDKEAVWRFVSMLREFPATALHQSVETTPSIKWRISFRMSGLLTKMIPKRINQSKVW